MLPLCGEINIIIVDPGIYTSLFRQAAAQVNNRNKRNKKDKKEKKIDSQ